MRYEFTDETIREDDIHPDAIFAEERKLAESFVKAAALSDRIEPCPICGAERAEILFEKWGAKYAICPASWTIGLGAAPNEQALRDYFHDSELASFRTSDSYQRTISDKRKELWEAQIGWIEGRVSRYLGNEKYVSLDWGSKFSGWLNYLRTAAFVKELYVSDALPPVLENGPRDAPADIAFLIDVIQREKRPGDLIRKVRARLNPGGLLIASCRAGSGFDVLTLRERSTSIFPFDHLLLPSPKGVRFLLEQSGFEVLEIVTPGLMDARYIQSAAEHIPKEQYFQRYIVGLGDEALLDRLQGFLQRNNLSSHLRCVARKK
jgi:hypothetical protein